VHDDDENLPEGTRETSPLIIGIVGIAIPWILLTLAATGGSTVVLVLAVIAMVAVAFATLMFVVRLTTDPPEQPDAAE
jgi:uncharacterized membrane protein HdeD (DUF308 family)